MAIIRDPAAAASCLPKHGNPCGPARAMDGLRPSRRQRQAEFFSSTDSSPPHLPAQPNAPGKLGISATAAGGAFGRVPARTVQTTAPRAVRRTAPPSSQRRWRLPDLRPDFRLRRPVPGSYPPSGATSARGNAERQRWRAVRTRPRRDGDSGSRRRSQRRIAMGSMAAVQCGNRAPTVVFGARAARTGLTNLFWTTRSQRNFAAAVRAAETTASFFVVTPTAEALTVSRRGPTRTMTSTL